MLMVDQAIKSFADMKAKLVLGIGINPRGSG